MEIDFESRAVASLTVAEFRALMAQCAYDAHRHETLERPRPKLLDTTANNGRTAAAPVDQGEDAHLVRCIEALLAMDADCVLVPHGLPGYARTLLSACASRLAATTPQAVLDSLQGGRR